VVGFSLSLAAPACCSPLPFSLLPPKSLKRDDLGDGGGLTLESALFPRPPFTKPMVARGNGERYTTPS
jgi:hypothetical protein